MNSPLVLSRLSKSFGESILFQNLSYACPINGFIGIVGESGSGKSTLLRLISGLDEEYKGSIFLFGKELRLRKASEMAKERLLTFGQVFQSDALLELEDVLCNVTLPSLPFFKGGNKDRAKALLRFVGLEGKESQRVSKLSGGERQRVALARALINDPPILLCDEPTGALDQENSRLVFSLLKELSKTRLVICVSHDRSLLEAYADTVLRFDCLPQENVSVEGFSLSNDRDGEKRLPLSFHWNHARHREKAKPLRSLLCSTSLTLGIMSLGIATYVASSLKEQIAESFEGIVKGNALVMKNEEAVCSQPKYCSMGRADSLAKEYPDQILSYGVSLQYDFSLFRDADEFLFEKGYSYLPLPGLSSRSINDFIWTEEVSCYEAPFSNLATDEVVLGAPYELMASFCSAFGLPQRYDRLQEFLDSSPIALLYHVAKAQWELDFSFSLFVRGIIPSDSPLFFHSSPRWNIDLLCGCLGIEIAEAPSSPKECIAQPFWYLKDGEVSDFQKELWLSEDHSDLMLERPQKERSLCWNDRERRSLKRAYAYEGIHLPFDLRELEEASKNISLLGYQFISKGGYFASMESIVMGFASKVAFSPSYDEVVEYAEAYGNLPIEEAFLPLALPPSCVEASLTSGAGGLQIDSLDMEGKEAGVYLSSALSESWGNPDKIYVAAERTNEQDGKRYSRDFTVTSIDIMGIYPSKSKALKVPSRWCENFYIDVLEAPALFHIPEGVVWTVEDESAIDIIRYLFPDSALFSPSSRIKEAVAETLRGVDLLLAPFAALSLTVSFALLLLTTNISQNESKKEDKTLVSLGISSSDIARSHRFTLLHHLVNALLPSVISLAAMQFLVDFFLCRLFGSPIKYSLSPYPFFACFVAVSLSYAMASFFLGIFGKRKVGKRV